jgi:hypothetical protein
MRLDAMNQSEWLAVRGNEIVPAARDVSGGAKAENGIRKGVAFVMIEEQPAVKLFAPERFLYAVEVHAIRE